MAYPYYNTPMQYSQQTQNGVLARIRDESEVLNYPVAPGCSVLFINEAVTHLWVKTAGLSQFDRPSVEKYALTRVNEGNKVEYATKQDIEALEARIAELKGETSDE